MAMAIAGAGLVLYGDDAGLELYAPGVRTKLGPRAAGLGLGLGLGLALGVRWWCAAPLVGL